MAQKMDADHDGHIRAWEMVEYFDATLPREEHLFELAAQECASCYPSPSPSSPSPWQEYIYCAQHLRSGTRIDRVEFESDNADLITKVMAQP